MVTKKVIHEQIKRKIAFQPDFVFVVNVSAFSSA
jgi:hypothetical protein